MTQLGQTRRTSVDEIFDHLHKQIATLRLRPGDRISEAEVAAEFGVSRQPVRDAFSRLEHLDLIRIRPQRATEVRRFSLREIEKARFVRAAIEARVLRLAAERCTDAGADMLNTCLERQAAAIAARNYRTFGKLDYDFHETICDVAGVPFAFDVILEEKSKVDRLCLLSLEKEDRMPLLLEDHRQIVEAITKGDLAAAAERGMVHLSRLDTTIETIAATNADYFDEE